MSTTTTPTNAEFRMGTKALLAAAMERTEKGNHTLAAKRARAEIARRDAKRAAKSTPLAPVASPATLAPVADLATDEDITRLLAAARKVALAVAESMAAVEAQANGGGFVKALIKARKVVLAEFAADPTPFMV